MSHARKRKAGGESKEEKAVRTTDRRSNGRHNDYVINSILQRDDGAEYLQDLWRRVTAGKKEVDRSDNPIHMSDCWTLGARGGYSYVSLGHGQSQLKLTQLALFITKKQVYCCCFFSKPSDDGWCCSGV